MGKTNMTRTGDRSVWLPKELLKKVQLVARIKKSMSIKSYITSVLEEQVASELAGIDESTLDYLFGDDDDLEPESEE